MDELGNWIYIILMVVVAISSFFRSVNKKSKQQHTHIPVPQSPEPSFPMPSIPSPPIPQLKEATAPPPVRKRVQYQSVASQITFPAEDVSANEIASMSAEEDFSMINELRLNDINDFQKAIIYAEIINRKYT
jgi:hypothetical protein